MKIAHVGRWTTEITSATCISLILDPVERRFLSTHRFTIIERHNIVVLPVLAVTLSSPVRPLKLFVETVLRSEHFHDAVVCRIKKQYRDATLISTTFLVLSALCEKFFFFPRHQRSEITFYYSIGVWKLATQPFKDSDRDEDVSVSFRELSSEIGIFAVFFAGFLFFLSRPGARKKNRN